MKETIEIINTVGKQWPFVLVIFFIVIIILRRKPIGKFFASITKVNLKGGGAEVHIDTNLSEDLLINSKKDIVNQDKVKPSEPATKDENKKDDLYINYIETLDKREFSKANVLFKELLDNETDKKVIKTRTLSNFFLRHEYGDTSAYKDLENYIIKIEDDNQHKVEALNYLGSFSLVENNNDDAIKRFQSALKLVQSDNQKSWSVTKLSEAYYNIGNKEKSIEVLTDCIRTLVDKKPLTLLYQSVAKYYEKEKNQLLESIASQKALELNPIDTTLIFDTAYKYSNIDSDFKDLSLLLYKQLIKYGPNHLGGLNNLGVTYQNLGLDIKSVMFYKNAFKKGNSLAGSNLAYLLMNQGFSVEAEEYLKKGQELDTTHDNIYSAVSELKVKISSEEDKETEIIKKANKKYRFFSLFGSAAFNSEKFTYSNDKNWMLDDKEVTIHIDKTDIRITWSSSDKEHKVSGEILNSAFILTYSRPELISIFNFDPDPSDNYEIKSYKGFGYIDSNHCIICEFEIDKKNKLFKFHQTNSK